MQQRTLIAMITLVLAASIPSAEAVGSDDRAVPAIHLSTLSLPGELNAIKRPLSLRLDRRHGEVFLCDGDANRVVVTDLSGVYRFEIPGGERFSTPLDTAIDSEGFIHVLGSTRDGLRVIRFDFDGLELGEVPLALAADADFAPSSLAFTQDDLLVVADREGPSVHVFDRDGVLLRSWNLTAMNGGMAAIGRLTVHDDRILVPMPTDGVVYEFDLTGEIVGRIGTPGNNVGELSFPVAVEIGDDDLVMILDKQRFMVVCHDASGRFIGEFGGKGDRDGWFYYPTLLLGIDADEVLVGQIYRHRIQRLQVPRFIRDAVSRRSESSGTAVHESNAPFRENAKPRRISHTSGVSAQGVRSSFTARRP